MISLKLARIKVLLLLGLVTATIGCVKNGTYFSTDTGDANRKPIVKIVGAGDLILNALNTDPTIEEFVLIEIARDPNSQTDLSQPLTVKLTQNATLIDDYNTANGAAFVELPANAYTLSDDVTNITFQPGEFSKQIKITLDKSALDLSNQYALGYSIADVGTGAVISASANEGLYGIIIKNKYDGHYRMTYTLVDAAVPTITENSPIEVDFETAGANVVIVNPTEGPFAFAYFFPLLSGGAASGYGSFAPVFIFDASDDVVQVVNAFGQPAGNTRAGELDPSGINHWNAADMSLDVKFWMNQPSVMAGHRSAVSAHFDYLRPR